MSSRRSMAWANTPILFQWVERWEGSRMYHRLHTCDSKHLDHRLSDFKAFSMFYRDIINTHTPSLQCSLMTVDTSTRET